MISGWVVAPWGLLWMLWQSLFRYQMVGRKDNSGLVTDSLMKHSVIMFVHPILASETL